MESSSYEERHARAADTFAVFVPGVDPERVSASLARRLGALGELRLRRRRRDVGAAGAVASGSFADRRVDAGRAGSRRGARAAHGDRPAQRPDEGRRSRRSSSRSPPMPGFPAAMAASRRVDAGLRAAEGVETAQRPRPRRPPSPMRSGIVTVPTCSRGVRWSRRHRSGGRPRVLSDALGDVGVLAYRWAFGEVWARTELSRRDRSLAVIAILTALGAVGRAGRPRPSWRPQRPVPRGDRGGHHPPHPVRRSATGRGGDAHGTRRVRAGRTHERAEGLVLTAPRRFELRRFDVPDVGDDDGVLRVEACGLCGTDHEQYTGHIPSRHAFIPGHEVIGTIEQVGRSGSRAVGRAGGTAGRRRGVPVVPRVRRLPSRRVPPVRAQRARHDGRVRRRRPPTRACGAGTRRTSTSGPTRCCSPSRRRSIPPLATMFNPLGAGIRWAVDLPGTAAR